MKRMLLIPVIALVLMTGLSSCAAKSTGSVSGAIQRYFPEQYDKAVAVAKCESGLNPRAISPGGANWGLFQINTVHKSRVAAMGYAWEQVLDPYVNARVARTIYNESGWRAWSCG